MTNYVANILNTFEQATPSEIEAGLNWYADAQAQCAEIAKRTGVSLAVAVGVVAALSPNNKWSRNLADGEKLIRAYIRGEHVESVKVSTYHAMRDKAWRILQATPETDLAFGNDAITKILNGRKITAFYLCIMGAETAVIDGHAYNIARGERHGLTSNATNIGKKLYVELEEAYRQAGRRLDLRPFEVQAITWTAWRRIHGIK